MTHTSRLTVKGLALVCLCLSLGLGSFQPSSGLAASRPTSTSFTSGYPNSMAATGDSISQAFDSTSYGNNPANAWSTGDNGAVQSHYLRLLASNAAISSKNFNDAVSGSQMSDLNGQMATAAGLGVDYVTVLMGANDICNKSSLADVTSVTDFTNQFRQSLTTFSTADPDARIFVSSIPDLYHLWYILHDVNNTNPPPQLVWDYAHICPLMLSSSGDETTRTQVRAIEMSYNMALQSVCAEFIHCRFDNDATFNDNFGTDDVSGLDYFHPSVQGQARLAAGSWAATFAFTDTVPPVSKLNVASNFNSGNLTATLTATDNAGVNGIEYRLDGGNWTRYTAPLILSSSNISLTYRSVDVNGNNETTHTLWVVGNGAATGGTGQTLPTALGQAKAGDTVGFALSGAPATAQVNQPLSVPNGVSILGGSCPGPLVRYTGSGSSTFTLGGQNVVSGLRLTGFGLRAESGGVDRLTCFSVNASF